MSKRHKAPERPQDCVTLADKIAFSDMMRERWQSIPYDAPPDAILDFDKYPMFDYLRYPFAHPEWSINHARSEREKMRAKRRMLVPACAAKEVPPNGLQLE